MTQEPVEPTTRRDVRQALIELSAAHPVRLSGRQAKRAISELIRRTRCSPAQLRSVWSDPAGLLGPFGSLPSSLRTALADAADWEFRERTLTVSDRFYRTVHGPLFHLGGALTHLGMRLGSKGRRWRVPGRTLRRCGRALTRGSRGLGRIWLERTRYTPFSRTSLFHALWKRVGVDPASLAQAYVREIPYEPRLSLVHRVPRINTASCALVGLDLMPARGQLVYLEANLCPGIRNNRLRLYPDKDRLLGALAGYARERGFKRLVFFPTSIHFFPRRVEQIWREQAAAAGLELEIRDDPFYRSPFRRPWEPLLDLETPDTLYVNGRLIDTLLAALIHRKGLLEAEIERLNPHLPEAERVRVPRTIRSPDDLPPPDRSSRFPNLIVKHSLLDMAEGIALYRTDRLPEGATAPPNVAFEYIPPDLMVQEENGVRTEHAVKYRAHLLVTPEGPVFLDALKAYSTAPIPPELPEGPVDKLHPYVVNGHLGAIHIAATPDQEAFLAPAVRSVGRAIDGFIRRKHDIPTGA